MTTLRRRMIEDMQLRNLSLHTQDAYVQQISLFARHFNRSPELLGPEEIRSYQLYLTNERKLAPSSIIIAVAALRFLYKITLHKDWSSEELIPTPKIPRKLPIVLSPEEVLQFLGCVRNIKHRTILTICYAAGLRVSEAICLKVTDIDSQRMVIRVEQGKGRTDRYVMLSPKLLQTLRDWWRVDRPKGVALPGRCSRQPHRQVHRSVGVPEGASTLPYSQTDHTPLPTACVCSSSPGIRHRRAHHSASAWSSQPRYHGHLSAHRHGVSSILRTGVS
jgi:integrase/recombinase XerD